MISPSDPFEYHPELREKIADPFQSFFRNFTTASLAKIARERGLSEGWWYSEEERESLRTRELANFAGGDLWVFAYGSLMWDPALRFAEVRRARVSDHARRFILKDVHGARGTRRAPGLMVALDVGPGCDGLAFRIAAEHVDEETRVLWQRERVGPAYTASFVDAEISGAPVKALTFVADYEAELIDAGMTRDEQVRYAATGEGFLGTSLDYLRGITEKFASLKIYDPEVAALLADAEAYGD